MDRSSRQKINKVTAILNDTIDQLDLIDIYRTLHAKTAEYTSFSGAHEAFMRIDNILDHKRSLNKFKRIQIISSIFSQQQYKTRNRLQKEKWEKNKYVETK